MALNIKYGVSTWLWTSPFATESANELFPKIAQMGFDVVEIAVEDPSLIDIKTVKKELNTDFLGGPMYSAVGKARMIPAEQRKAEWELAVKNLRKVCGMAEKRNLKIALEPLNRFES